MCDILRRLASPDLTKQQYLSSLNEFSRLCRAKRREELFQVVGHGPATTTTTTTTSTTNTTSTALDPIENNKAEGSIPVFKLNETGNNEVYTIDGVFSW